MTDSYTPDPASITAGRAPVVSPDLHAMYQLGFALGPLIGKVPATQHGFKDFTRDRQTLSRWTRRYPHCNWGGTCEGVICLDVDPRNGGTINGLDIDLTATLVVETGSGGLHIYYRFPGTTRGKLADAEGIDLKHWQTGYLVMPGSIHPDTGRAYRIVHHSTPAPLPEHLLNRVEQRRWSAPVRPLPPSPSRNHGLVNKVASAVGGGRNQITFWAFCRALERGADAHLIDDIRDAALATGLPPSEIETCLRSAHNTVRRSA